MASETVENYLKAIYALTREAEGPGATVTRVAALVGVTPGSATAMLQKLAAGKLARYQRYGAATLTPRGERAAAEVLRRHRIIEQFLTRVVGMDWSEVHEEAERLEHAVSPRLLERLDAMLGHPTHDPHGDPIPDAEGRVSLSRAIPLSRASAGMRARVSRVLDQSPEFLRFAQREGLTPGRVVTVEASDEAAQAVRVRVGSRVAATLALSAAAKVLVEPAR